MRTSLGAIGEEQHQPSEASSQKRNIPAVTSGECSDLPTFSAIGINRPSLHAAFGDKRALFSKVLDRYVVESRCRLQEALQEPTAQGFAERVLRAGATSMCSSGNPRGCILVQGALACGEAADSVKAELISRRHADELMIRNRLKRAKKEGDLASRF